MRNIRACATGLGALTCSFHPACPLPSPGPHDGAPRYPGSPLSSPGQHLTADTMTGASESRACVSLPLELRLHILSFLPPNDLALGGRLSCKDAAQHFSQPPQRTVGLGQPLSAHAAACWQEWGEVALRELTLRQKLLLLRTAASSGCETNFELAWQLLQPHVFPELLQTDHYCTLQPATTSGLGPAVVAGGLAHLLPSLAQRCPGLLDPETTLRAAVLHCDLAGLQVAWGLLGQRLTHSLEQEPSVWDSDGEEHDRVHPLWRRMLGAAARSTTPDAVAKLDWALERGGEAARAALEHKAVCGAAASTGDMARVQWLRERGFPWGTEAALDALLEHAELAFIQQLEEEGGYLPPAGDAAWRAEGLACAAAAALKDSAAKLRWLESKGVVLGEAEADAVEEAAGRGDLDALQLLKEQLVAGGVEDWRGPDGGVDALDAAVRSGCTATASWLLQEGCTLQPAMFRTAFCQGDLATVRWLLEVGCDRSACSMQAAVQLWPNGEVADGERLVEALQLLAAVMPPPQGSDAELVHVTALRAKHPRVVVRAVQELVPLHAQRQQEQGQVQRQQRRAEVYWPGQAVGTAVAAGCEATLEVLLGQVPDYHGFRSMWPSTWYAGAARTGDRGTLACLRRLGVPLDTMLLGVAVVMEATLPGLRWLVEQGAPVSSEAVQDALENAQLYPDRPVGRRGELVAWLEGLLGDEAVGAGAAEAAAVVAAAAASPGP